MEKHIEVIGIDHGWSNMKTATQIFTTGVKEITTEPAFYDDVVELDGKYYKVGGKHLEVRDTKVENDNFYLLTLAAVAKELNRRGMKNADVLLSVGLPLTRFGAEKQDFIDYLSKKKEVAFRFEKEKYTARIARVSVFPQCYAAVAEQLRTLPGRVVVVDIGSWTIDIIPIENGKPNEAECITNQQGLIRCMRIINEECNRQIGQELEENVIQQVMATGKAALPDKYMNIVKDCFMYLNGGNEMKRFRFLIIMVTIAVINITGCAISTTASLATKSLKHNNIVTNDTIENKVDSQFEEKFQGKSQKLYLMNGDIHIV